MLTFTAQPNIEYFVVVEGFNTYCGTADVQFEVMPAPPPPNPSPSPSPAPPPRSMPGD